MHMSSLIWDEHWPLIHWKDIWSNRWHDAPSAESHNDQLSQWHNTATVTLTWHSNCHSEMTHQLSQWHDTNCHSDKTHPLSQWHNTLHICHKWPDTSLSPHLVELPPPSLLCLQLGEEVVVGHQLSDDGLLIWSQDIHIWGGQQTHTVWCDHVTITWPTNMEIYIPSKVYCAQLEHWQICQTECQNGLCKEKWQFYSPKWLVLAASFVHLLMQMPFIRKFILKILAKDLCTFFSVQ